MFKEIIRILCGSFIWNILRFRLRINSKKVVIILVGENRKLDYYAMHHLKDYMERKCVDHAIILLDDRKTYKMVKKVVPAVNLKIYRYSKDKMERLYNYYSFYKFSERVVFTYTDYPRDNQLGKALRETTINEEDAVCLGLYHLRTVPAINMEKIGRQDYV